MRADPPGDNAPCVSGRPPQAHGGGDGVGGSADATLGLRSYPLGGGGGLRGNAIPKLNMSKRLQRGYEWLKRIKEDRQRPGWRPRSQAVHDSRNARSFHGMEKRMGDVFSDQVAMQGPVHHHVEVTTKSDNGRVRKHWRTRPEALELPSPSQSPVRMGLSPLWRVSSSNNSSSGNSSPTRSTTNSPSPVENASSRSGSRSGSRRPSWQKLINISEQSSPNAVFKHHSTPGTPTRERILELVALEEDLPGFGDTNMAFSLTRTRSF